jgi:hypothetical protein
VSDYLPPIVTKLDGDLSGLAKTFAEAEAMADEYGRNVEKTIDEHAKAAGEKGGQSFTEEFEKEAAKGVDRLRDERGRFRKAIEDTTDEVGGGGGKSMASRFWDSFTSNSQSAFDKLSGSAPAGMTQWLVMGAVIAAPAIGAAINAGVLLGVGGGGLAAGFIAAAQDDRVKAAFKSGVSEVWGSFQRASSPLVEPMIRGAKLLQTTFDDAMPGVQRAFERAQPYVDRLFTGINGMVRELGPGFAEAFGRAMPLIGELGDDLPRIGHAVSDMLSVMSHGAPGAIQFLHDFTTGLDTMLRVTGGTVTALSMLYDQMRTNSAQGAVLGGTFNGWMTLLDKLDQGSDKGKKSFQKIGEGADDASKGIDKATKSISDFISEALKMQDSDIALARGLQDVAKSFDQNGRSININTEAGLANRSALQSQIETIAQHRQDLIDQGKAMSYVNDWTYKQIQAMRDAAVAHGGDKAAIDKLIESWEVMLHLPSEKTFTTRLVTIQGQVGTAGPLGRRAVRYGGIVHAAGGLVTEPGIYRGRGAGTVVAFEEETEQEGFVPKRGISRAHAYDLISTEAGWYDIPIGAPGSTVPAPSGGSARSSGGGGYAGQPIVIQFQVDGRTFHEEVVMPAAQQYKGQTGSTGLT